LAVSGLRCFPKRKEERKEEESWLRLWCEMNEKQKQQQNE